MGLATGFDPYINIAVLCSAERHSFIRPGYGSQGREGTRALVLLHQTARTDSHIYLPQLSFVMRDTMTAFVAYRRVSTDRQGRSGLGLDAQKEAVSRFARNEDAILAMFVEVESGRKSSELN